jgi:predicted secreted protein
MTEARIGWGVEVWLDNASNVLTQLEECIAIGLPNSQVEDVEATHMLSPNRRREYIAGLIDDGEGVFEFNLVPGGATDLLIQAAVDDGVARDFEVIIPDGAFGQKFAGDCIVKGYERSIPIDDRMTASMTVRYTGSTTITTLLS